MTCLFEYCIHNRASCCTLPTISIDAAGMCEDCIMVELDEGLLETEKDKQAMETYQTLY